MRVYALLGINNCSFRNKSTKFNKQSENKSIYKDACTESKNHKLNNILQFTT